MHGLAVLGDYPSLFHGLRLLWVKRLAAYLQVLENGYAMRQSYDFHLPNAWTTPGTGTLWIEALSCPTVRVSIQPSNT